MKPTLDRRKAASTNQPNKQNVSCSLSNAVFLMCCILHVALIVYCIVHALPVAYWRCLWLHCVWGCEERLHVLAQIMFHHRVVVSCCSYSQCGITYGEMERWKSKKTNFLLWFLFKRAPKVVGVRGFFDLFMHFTPGLRIQGLNRQKHSSSFAWDSSHIYLFISLGSVTAD